jgi:adenine deaminase
LNTATKYSIFDPMFHRITEEETHSLIRVSQGMEPADLAFRGGRVLNVYTGEILEQDVLIKGNRIAYVGKYERVECRATEVIDVSGTLLSPGYIDPHAHADLSYDITALSQAVLPIGTTALFSDSRYLGMTLGRRGLDLLKMEGEAVPLKIFYGIPATAPSYPALEGKSQMDLSLYASLLKDSDFRAVSEIYPWIQINRRDDDLIHRLYLARASEKRIEGHLPGASSHSLAPSVIAGVTSDHEAITAKEALDRLRMGLHVILRNGSIRDDLPALAALVTDPAIETSCVMLSPDFMSPRDILEKGYMDYVIRVAMENGIPPVKAYQMSTINPARYFGVDCEVGGISPGKSADILLLRDIREPAPLKVMVNGRWVAEQGRLLVELKRPLFPFSTKADIPTGWVSENDLNVRSGRQSFKEVAVLTFSDKTITRIERVKVPSKDGLLIPDPGQMVQKIAMPRLDQSGLSVAFVRGFTRDLGAISIGLCHDSVMPFVVGSNDRDMMLAFHWLADTGGGIVIIHDGELLFQLPLPLGGVASDLPMNLLADRMDAFVHTLRRFGCTLPDPFMTFLFIPFTVLPYVRMTPCGLLDVIPFRIIENP